MLVPALAIHVLSNEKLVYQENDQGKVLSELKFTYILHVIYSFTHMDAIAPIHSQGLIVHAYVTDLWSLKFSGGLDIPL
jgi:hypothetical protein